MKGGARVNTPSRPIGYWLKRLDRTIEDAFDRDLACWSLTRRHWQVLNTLAAEAASDATIAQALAPFLAEGAITQQEVLEDLLRRGWLERSDALLSLTAAGVQAHSLVSSQVNVTRAKILDGLSPEDYATVLRLLERMTLNLDAADESTSSAE
jgi:DNA-binding MarR family transcriptional regulator